ncbi:leucine-rich repeat domain-containing protein [Dyadobacter chenhuakuii]|uniref:Leucine-rich repeat domain-containing protein n=1 Tax=Dyadobacter chenhuakuii TaxID=2909339 RepID=A0A9X1Q9W7_9BACT|nr:leucine-rich repeat domain-containing protein [Dyadobacter chenhuakuii]MCF2497301.1 leucine-rich repeat domain-containing protein [Dyadobacter chenhuakuii]
MKAIFSALICLCVQCACAQMKVVSSKNLEKEGIDPIKIANEYGSEEQSMMTEVMKKTSLIIASAFPENPNPGITVFTQIYVNESGSLDYLIFDLRTGDGYDKDSLDKHAKYAFLTGLDGWKVSKTGKKFSVVSVRTVGKQPVVREVRRGDSSVVDLKTALVFQDTLKTKRLYLNQLELKTLPEVIYRFPNLEELYLGNNELQAVYIDMARLPKLAQLHLQQNKLTEKSFQITGNNTLYLLNLKENKFTNIPPAIRKCKKLRTLWLGGNQMSALSNGSFRKLKSVQDLNFYKSDIAVLPKGIKKMKNLEVLDLYYNQLKMLPKSITKLKNLTHLAVSYNQIKALPERIDKLSRIHTLYAHHNRLSKLPASITKMQNLKILDLGFNWFTNFPPELTAFVKLQELDLSSNNFPDFPEQLLEIKKLEKLYLRGNPFVKDDAETKYSRQLGQLKSKNIEVFY